MPVTTPPSLPLAPYLGFAVFGAFWGAWGAAIPAVRNQANINDGQLGTALLFVGVGALPAMLLAGGPSTVSVSTQVRYSSPSSA